MGIIAVTCAPEEQDVEISAEIAKWIEAFHPQVSARADANHIILASSTLSEQRLRSIWRVASLNERLFTTAKAARADVIGRLVA